MMCFESAAFVEASSFSMIDEAAMLARDLIAQGFGINTAAEHAALIYDVREADVIATLRAWRELPAEFDQPKGATW